MTFDRWLSIGGLVFGFVGAISGYYSFVLSGHRVKVRVGIALEHSNGWVMVSRDWQGSFGSLLIHPQQVRIYVRVINRGRMPAQVERVDLGIRKHFWNQKTYSRLLYFDPPFRSTSVLPFEIGPGESAVWLLPSMDVFNVADNPSLLKLSSRRRAVVAEVELSDEHTRRSRKQITARARDRFERELTQYMTSQR
jgi:hypothetical protein